jgi:hypothetical protein
METVGVQEEENSATLVEWWQQAPTYSFPGEVYFERLSQIYPYNAKRYEIYDLRGPARVARRTLRPAWQNPFTVSYLNYLRQLEQGTEGWRNERNFYLSSSRFGVIAGEHPQAWETPIDFWRDSTGRTYPKVFGPRQQSFMDHGKHYEPIARSVYERLTQCGPLVEEGMRIDLKPPFLYSASPDGVGAGQLIEIKCKAIGALYTTTPEYYLPQIIGAAAIYQKPFSDFVGYWARTNRHERFMICQRVYMDNNYWRLLRLRLDYMAWCCIRDVPPTGMLALKKHYPLPQLRIEDRFFYEGRAVSDDDLTAPLVNLLQ